MKKHGDEAEWLANLAAWDKERPGETPPPLHPDDVAAIAAAPCLYWRKVWVHSGERGNFGVRWVIDIMLPDS